LRPVGYKFAHFACNVTALLCEIQVFLNTSFESCSPLVNDSPHSARTHVMSQLAATANRFFLHFTR